jgi:type II restriction enzyme
MQWAVVRGVLEWRRPVGKIEEAQDVLTCMGLPPAQRNEIAALTLLALCGLGPEDNWSQARRPSLGVSKGIMDFIRKHYGKEYAPNTREKVRRQVLHQFVQAHLADYNPDNSNLPTNSPRAHYALTPAAHRTVRTYGTVKWQGTCKRFLASHGSLRDKYGTLRIRRLVPVQLPDGRNLELSPGEHNMLQAAVIEGFLPRFAPGSRLLYLGDTAKKNLYLDEKGLSGLGVALTDHDKLPDVVFYDPNKNRLFLVEAVTSHGPMSPKRHMELEAVLCKCPVKRIFVSAFKDFKSFKNHMESIAWETEVWIADVPDHMIHYDGERFLSLP